jgi:hypothetical protein
MTWRNVLCLYTSGIANQIILKFLLNIFIMVSQWKQIRNFGEDWEQGTLGRMYLVH